MKFPCTILRTPDGRWLLRHVGPEVGQIEVTAATRDEATEKLRGEIRYRLELCPCTGESFRHVQVEIDENQKNTK